MRVLVVDDEEDLADAVQTARAAGVAGPDRLARLAQIRPGAPGGGHRASAGGVRTGHTRPDVRRDALPAQLSAPGIRARHHADPGHPGDVGARDHDERPVTASPLGIVISSPGTVVSTLVIIGAIVLAVTVALGAVAAKLLARRFLRPLEALARVSAAFGDGDLAHRAPGAEREDEFGTVTRAFNGMLDRTERAMTISERFAANASHELRSPLATTKTLLDVARQDLTAVEPGPLLAKLAAANDRSIAIVEALLDLADAGRGDVDIVVVDVACVVASAAADLAAEAAERGVAITPRLAPGSANANLALVRQAVGNLLANAVRHNVSGGAVSVETGTDLRSGWALVRIRNTGPIVDPRVIGLLGEPFYRIRPRYRPAGQGDSHGLGLPIALAIAEALGGSLALTANDGGGLTVELRLPTANAQGETVPMSPHECSNHADSAVDGERLMMGS
ncbi:MAG: HAMP domain-containing sensor histidine kinase [Trebonia sp.]